MSLLFFTLIALSLSLTATHDLKKTMEEDGTIPQILARAPPDTAHVIYKGEKIHASLELTPEHTKDAPVVQWPSKPGKFYTLVMVDPDAPSRENPIVADVKHWLVGNIKDNKVSEADVIAEYFGPGPPHKTGLHRYIFLIYEQKQEIVFDEPRSLKLSRANRLKWSLKAFVEKNQLGEPIAANYFKAQWEPYVDERNKFVN